MAPKAQDKAESKVKPKAQGKKTKSQAQASGDDETVGERIANTFKPSEKDHITIAFMYLEKGHEIDTQKFADALGIKLRSAQSVLSRIRGKYRGLHKDLTADDGNVTADSDGHADDGGGDDNKPKSKAEVAKKQSSVAKMVVDVNDENGDEGDDKDDAGSDGAKKATAVGRKRKVANKTAEDGSEVDGNEEGDGPKTKKAKKSGCASNATGAGKAVKAKKAKQ